jgi:rubrerythrin
MGEYMNTNSKIKSSLIARCGMNCALCYAFQREKNKCPGCRALSAGMPVSIARCKIRTCGFFVSGNTKFCYQCTEFPCKNLKHLDKRYRIKYGASMIENLNNIKITGIRKFIAGEQAKWTCRNCGKLLCVHKTNCPGCGAVKKSPI